MSTRVDYDSNSDRVIAKILGGTFAGMVVAGEALLTESNVFVPHEEGILESSGAVSEDRSEMVVAVSYDTVYAVRQHEELTWRHNEGRKAKYLEHTAHEMRDELAQIVTVHARRSMQKG